MNVVTYSFQFQVATALVGALIGLFWAPFSSVLSDRPPLIDATESVRLPFRCPQCRQPLAGLSWLPFIGALMSRGKCGIGGESIHKREIWNDSLCVVLGFLTGGFIGFQSWLPAMLVVALVMVPVTLVDLETRLIATKLVYPSALVTAVLLFGAAVAESNYWAFFTAMMAGAGAWSFIWLLHLIYPIGMGGGDARLCLMLGMACGWFGWTQAILGIMIGFVIGSLVGIPYGIVTKQYLKAQLPFGPWLGLGAVLMTWFQ
jgi:leader peptidase (prepilin peptidase) / N-methyltransferase